MLLECTLVSTMILASMYLPVLLSWTNATGHKVNGFLVDERAEGIVIACAGQNTIIDDRYVST